MKKRNLLSKTLVLSLLLFPISIFAQQLPDPSFEDWSGSAFDGNAQLKNWNGSNVKQTYMGITAYGTMVTKSTKAHTGSASAKISNVKVEAAGIGESAPAWLTLGTPFADISNGISGATAGTYGGTNFTYRPDTMALWIIRESGENEPMNFVYYSWKGTAVGSSYMSKSDGCVTISTKYDEESDIRLNDDANACGTTTKAEQVAEGHLLKVFKSYSTWTEIKVPINYLSNSVPEKMNIIISGGNYPNKRATDVNLGSALYADDIRLIYSSCAHKMYFGSRQFYDFQSNVYEYYYSLGKSATDIPEITAYRSGRLLSGSEISIHYGEIDGEATTVTIKAEDGSSTTTYTIHFVSELSVNSLPANIEIDGTWSPNFNAYTNDYTISLPYGTTHIPTINVTKSEEKQTVEIDTTNVVPPCTAKVTVYAADKSYSSTYNFNFVVAELNDNTLKDILVNGISIEGFSPTKTNYKVNLPVGTTDVPTITPVSAYEDGIQTIVATNNGLSGTYTIEVSSAASTIRTYKITFNITESSNSLLKDLLVGGVSLPSFNPNTFTYEYQLPQGTTTLPDITWEKAEDCQTVAITSTNGVEGDTKITVTAQNGSTSVYRIRFSVFKSDICTLDDLQVDGISIDSFRSDSFYYECVLPSGTTVLPTISYTLTDSHATTKLTTNGVNGITTIRVIAEDGVASNTYQIKFSVIKSADAELINIIIDGVDLADFNPKTLDYRYQVASGVTTIPSIVPVPKYENQTIEMIMPDELGVVSIKVYSESGDSYNIYTVNFSSQSNNCYLKDIRLDGTTIAGYDKTNNTYVIDRNDETLPVLSFTKDDKNQSVVVVKKGMPSGYSLIVTAEDGTQNIYNISFNVAQSGNALLKDIQIFDGNNYLSLDGFSSSKFDYVDTLAWRTKDVPNVRPIVGQKSQVVTITYGKIDETTTLHVVAENGATQDYTIKFPVKRSNSTKLVDITIDDATLTPAFSSDVYEYVATLPYGTTIVPLIHWEKEIDEQVVTLNEPNIHSTTTLTVTAEDGTTATYKFTFAVQPSGLENKLKFISVEGVGAFTDTDINLELPFGTTVMPTISYEKNYPEQSVIVDNGGLYSNTTITVISNQAGVADQIYTIHPSIAKTKAVLTDLAVDGNTISGFDPYKTEYVVSLDYTDGVNMERSNLSAATTSPAKFTILEVNSKSAQVMATYSVEYSDTTYYTLHFYYSKDIIPNGEFTDWTTAANNSADKPVSWTVPADAASSFSALGKYSFGDEVKNNGNGVVQLNTCYGMWSIGGSFPGMMTIGSMSISCAVNNGTTSSTSGTITFRNTPNNVKMYYNPVSSTDVDNIRFLLSIEGNTTTYTREYTDNNFSNSWKTMDLSLMDNIAMTEPTGLHITINAAESENAGSLQGSFTNKAVSQMLVDWVRFGYSSKLNSVNLNGSTLSLGSNTNQTVAIAADYQGLPVLSDYVGEVDDEEFTTVISDEVLNGANKERTISITAKAEDGSTTLYTITAQRPLSSNKQLSNILVNDTAIAGFNAATTTYNVEVPNGTILTPDVTVIRSSMHQTAAINANSSKATIVVTAENGETTTYTINFVEAKSNVATLFNIAIEGNPSDFNFDANVNTYNVALATDATLPEVTFTKSSDGQTVVLTTGDVVTITVTAENGTTNNTYTIDFRTIIASDGKLNDIKVNDDLVADFSQDGGRFTCNKTNDLAVTYNKKFIADNLVAIHYPDSIDWTSSNASDSYNYRLVFINSASSNSTLGGIDVEGNPLAGFDPDSTYYTYTSDTIPDVVVTPGDEGQTINIDTDDDNINITVTAEDGVNASTYTIYTGTATPKSNNALLADLRVEGVSINGFAPTTFEYDYLLPVGTTKFPIITAVKGEIHQTVTISNGGLRGTTTIHVIAEDGVTENTYIINFDVAKSSNALLADIAINNSTIEGFNPTTFEYSIVLPIGTTLLPTIEYTKGDEMQTVVTAGDNVNGDYTFTVTSEDGTHTNVYTIHFSVAKSDNSYLQMIYSDGTAVNGFDEETFSYNIVLPYGTTTLPVITYDKQEDVQTIEQTDAASLSGTTTIVVTAENGINTSTYTITYSIAKSNNALLKMIYIGGEQLAIKAINHRSNMDFESAINEYEVLLPVGTTELPIITWETMVPDVASATLVTGGVSGVSVITVVSQDGSNTEEYSLSFSVMKSDNNRLIDLTVDGLTIDGFSPDTIKYTLRYPVGTMNSEIVHADNIGYTVEDPRATVVVEQKSATEILVKVTAENGDLRVYVITIKIALSDNSLLADILIGGVSIDDFQPTKFEYVYYIYQGDAVPEIVPIKSEEIQVTEMIDGFVSDKMPYTISCYAEDGSYHTYEVLVLYSDANKSLDATSDDIEWFAVGNGTWKAESTRDRCFAYIFDTSGRLLQLKEIPAVNANDQLSPEANGAEFTFDKKGKIYIGVISFGDKKKRLKTVKIRW